MDSELLEAPPAEWAHLATRDPNATPSHRPALWSILGSAFHMTRRFIAATDGAALQGGSPVLIQRRGGLHWLHALPRMLSAAPLAVPGAHAAVDEAVAIGLGELQRRLRAVSGEWALYRPCGPPPEENALAAVGGEVRYMEASVVTLEKGLDAARAAMQPEARYALRRARRRLHFGEEPEALPSAYALHLAQGRGWHGHQPLPLELLRRLLAAQAPGEEPLARLFTARDGRGILSSALVLDGTFETMVWWSGSRPEARAQHAFTLIMGSVVEWAHARGRRRVNLGASAGQDPVAAFKRSLGGRPFRYPVCWLDARHAPPLGRVAAVVQNRLRRGRPRGTRA